ncbi:MAG: RNA-directed DNA polymerase, partial [Microgenomates group bacterium]
MPNTIFTPANIFKAYLDCRKTKRQTINALKYELDLESNLTKLQQELTNKTYYPSRSICFIVTTPKPREIFAAEFNDRIVHHILINQVQNIWEKRIFIPDSYACRKGKGHHYGVSRVFQFAKRFAFYGQFDIANFFSSIDKDILYHCFSQVILKEHQPDFWKEEILWLTKTIIFHNPTQNFYYKGNPRLIQLVPFGKSLFDQNEKTGLPIGNLTSQFFANVYLNELDQYITRTLGCLAYGRYVDDFLLFSDTKEEIIRWRNEISMFLASSLHLSLHPRKQQIQPTRHGIPFVGYFIKPWGITVRRNVVKNIKSRLYFMNSKKKNPEQLV